jgi:hypothetical protein
MNLIEYLLACYGITLIITQSKIFKPFRDFLKLRSNFMYYLFSCMMCLGFWVGLSIFLLDSFITYGIISYSLIFYAIMYSAIVSGVNWFFYLVLLNLEKYVKDEL